MTVRRLLVADDHAVVRDGLREIAKRGPGLAVVAEAADGDEALRLAREGGFDLLVLDISLPGRNGIEVLRELRAAGSRLPVLFFSMHPAAQYADYVRREGAQGFLNKDADGDAVRTAMLRIIEGGTAFPPRNRIGPVPRGADPFASLSRREAEVMAGLIRGDSLEDIANSLGVSAKSVTTYRRRLLDKLGVHSNAELAAQAARRDRL